MTANRQENGSTAEPTLHLAFELGWSEWKLAFTIGHGQSPRIKTIRARNLKGLLWEIAKAKTRFGLPESAPLVSCYEAGRDGFWLHPVSDEHRRGQRGRGFVDATGQRPDAMVSKTLLRQRPARPQGGHRGPGPEVADRPVALSRARRGAARRRAEPRSKGFCQESLTSPTS